MKLPVRVPRPTTSDTLPACEREELNPLALAQQACQGTAPRVTNALIRGGSGKLWQVYRSLCGYPPSPDIGLMRWHAVQIDDETADFDSLRDYQSFLKITQGFSLTDSLLPSLPAPAE